MKISKYYEVWSDDSLEASQTDNRGTCFENRQMTPKQLVREMGHLSIGFELGGFGNIHFYETYAEPDYRTNEKTYFSWFVGQATKEEVLEVIRAIRSI